MTTEEQNEKLKYSHMIIDKSKRAFLLTVICIAIVGFSFLIFENIVSGRHWTTVALPLCFFGTLFIAVPRSESWVYEPWQSRHQQYERHYNDSK